MVLMKSLVTVLLFLWYTKPMKLKTRLIITFLTIVLLPTFLTITAFIFIGGYLTRSQQELGFRNSDYSVMIDPAQASRHISDEVFLEAQELLSEDSDALENPEILAALNAEVMNRSSYILIRKNDQILYAGNEQAASIIFDSLPDFSAENITRDMSHSVYYDNMNKLVRQMDFYFPDGGEGSLFVITRSNTSFSKILLIDMAVAIMIILIITSWFLTKWIGKGVFTPVNQLNIAMQNIAEGNLEYHLPENMEGEIGELYRNYEDMRLRLKESTDEKILAEKQNRELVSNISHDLKTPITAVKGYVEGIMDGVADTPEKMDRYVRTIYNKTNEMDHLINELTFYSKIDTNRIPYTFSKLNVDDYFSDCAEEVGLELETRGIQLYYANYVEKDVLVIADGEQIRRVIHNIISNAIKYMDKPKGVIQIRVKDVGDFIQVEIEDNGKGIASKDLTYIFDRFYRTDVSRNSSKGGSGIGLSIVRKILEDHGGKVWATSREGIGTIMYFVLRKYQEVPMK